jgi:hypothetical protein
MLGRLTHTSMKFAISATLSVLLMFSPALCMALACDIGLSHDCCPKSHTMTACPYDVLASAKVVKAQAVSVLTQFLVVGLAARMPSLALEGTQDVADGRRLYAQNRVLRI